MYFSKMGWKRVAGICPKYVSTGICPKENSTLESVLIS